MDQRGKRLLMIAGLVALLFLGLAVYFIFFNKPQQTGQAVNVDKNLFPFAQKSNSIQQLPVVNTTDTGNTGSTSALATPIESRERLRKITSFPVSGFISFLEQSTQPETVLNEKTKKEETILRPVTIHHIRYNDQRTGHIFDGIVTDTSILNKQITKTDLPPAEELLFANSGKTGYLRYEKNGGIVTFKINIPEPPQVPTYCNYSEFSADLKFGSRVPAVKNLQQYINAKFNQKNKVDGVFGKGTITWVKQIQKAFVLPQTGILDQSTRTAMSIDCTTIRDTVAKSQSEPLELTGSLVSGYITQAVKDSSDDLFMLQTLKGQMGGFWGTMTGDTRTPVFNSSFNEWMPQVANKNFIGMTTYASGASDGYFYQLNPTTQQFSKILGPLTALTTLVNPDGTNVLITDSENNRLITKIINIKTQRQTILPFVTLPEKCTWYNSDQVYCGVPNNFPSGTYPDDWYKGIVKFSDSLWSYEISSNRTTQIATPTDSIDIFRMNAFPDAGYLFFMNKSTYELWSYRIGGSD